MVSTFSPLLVTGGASCDSSCAPGAGCLGPNNPSLCGVCRRLEDNSNTCDAVPTPPPRSSNSMAIILGVVIPIVIIILLVLLALGIWGAVVLSRRWKEGRNGSFDVTVSLYVWFVFFQHHILNYPLLLISVHL